MKGEIIPWTKLFISGLVERMATNAARTTTTDQWGPA